MIQGHGYSATAAAIAMLPAVACMAILTRVGTFLARTIGARIVLTFGPAIVTIGFILLGFFDSTSSYWTAFFPGLLIVGIGLGFTVAPLTATAIDTADPRYVGSASGINNAIARTAGLLAIAALGVALWTSFNTQLDSRLDAAHISTAVRTQVNVQRAKIGGARVNDPQAEAIILASFRVGFSTVAYTCALLSFCAGLIAFMAISPQQGKST